MMKPLVVGVMWASLSALLPGQTVIHSFPVQFQARSVAGAGDVNGDGFQDILVTEGSYTSVKVFSGRDGSTLHHLTAGPISFGWSLDAAGDVDGDGYDDFIVGAPNGGPTMQAGEATIFSGATGSVIHQFFGAQFDNLGRSVAGIGDVDGDGYPDVIVGAPGPGFTPGYATVYSGLTGGAIHVIGGHPSNGFVFGFLVAAAGDLNGDGWADFLVCDPNEANAGGTQGSVRAFSGLTGGVLHQWFSLQPQDGFGTSAAGGADVDGDGLSDVLAGAHLTNGGAGVLWVFSGATGSVIHTITGGGMHRRMGGGVAMMGDMDGDGLSEFATWSLPSPAPCCPPAERVLVLRGSDGSVMTMTPSHRSAVFDVAGDVNADGVPDLVLGGHVVSLVQTGRVWVYALGNVPLAGAVPLGTGCGPGGDPSLVAEQLPVLGQSATFLVSNASLSTPGVLVLSPPTPGTFAIGGGCIAYVDPTNLLVLATFTTDATGHWSASFPISGDVILAGLRLRVQAALTPTGSALPVLTNALDLKLGYL